ncbi:MAG: hypothetical protein FJ100_16580 [Deltaproteobacteria bacterium]|nr:hypothetical protein [Deltaproteobacteria bacterium]
MALPYRQPLDQTLAVLAGAIGDHLARTGNALAEPMALVVRGNPVALDPASVARAFPAAAAGAVLLVHGLMATEHGFALGGDPDAAEPQDFGSRLAASHGLTPLRLRYNSGLPRRANAQALDALLEALVEAWPRPLDRLVLVGHSMGGLVVREACALAAAAGRRWVATVSHCVYLGTPHLGAPLERWGRRAVAALRALPDPLAQALGEVGDLRSRGIRELGDPAELPWLATAEHLLVASVWTGRSPLAGLVGDGMVSHRSALALGGAGAPPARVTTRTLHGLHHAQLPSSTEVGELIGQWLPGASTVPHQAAMQGAPPPAARAPARWRGLWRLADEAATHGHRAVATVRLGRAAQVSEAVKGLVPGSARVMDAAQAAHGAAVVAQHTAVELGLAAARAAVAIAEAAAPQTPGSPTRLDDGQQRRPPGMAATLGGEQAGRATSTGQQ